jgi:hypothetical protein
MTGIQATERREKDLPMRPGKVERREFEYIRHGTQTLIANFDIATGKIIEQGYFILNVDAIWYNQAQILPYCIYYRV